MEHILIRIAEILYLVLQSPVIYSRKRDEKSHIETSIVKSLLFELDGSVYDEGTLGRELEQIIRMTSLGNGQIDVYAMIRFLSKKLLYIRDGEAVYRYQYIKVWNFIHGKMDDNVFISYTYMDQDRLDNHVRFDFVWPEILRHDNSMLNKILDRGISENHFHLWGSGPHFTLAWISLMNDVRLSSKVEKYFTILEMDKTSYMNAIAGQPEKISFSILHLRAALIRVYLYARIMNKNIDFEDSYSRKNRKEIDHISQNISERAANQLWQMLSDDRKLVERRYEIQGVIDSFHIENICKNRDYMMIQACRGENVEWEHAVLSGESWLTYKVLSQMGNGSVKSKEQLTLFLEYLSIKERFRKELILSNDKVGFLNFQTYDKRKAWFVTRFSDKEFAKIAVRNAFSSQNLISMEIRVIPRDTAMENCLAIKNYDRCIGLKSNDRDSRPFYYVYHFKRKRDMESKIESQNDFFCRHYYYRKKLYQKALAIIRMRNTNPRVAARVKGIDACSWEDGCRPEVFATAFRVLRSHIAYDRKYKCPLPQLRVTYHVGEENQDILDGLRAIDEAVFFMEMKSGERLGHAMALGMDVFEWYQKHNACITIRSHDFLDDVVWLYHQIVRFQISNSNNLLEYLESKFRKYFNQIYAANMDKNYVDYIVSEKNEKQGQRSYSTLMDFDIYMFYDAWKLRGDEPALYETGYYIGENITADRWKKYAVNSAVDMQTRRRNEPSILYHMYHYNNAICRKGNEIITEDIPYSMMAGICEVQKKLRNSIAKKGIAIEANPSSNIRIGGLDGFDKHPIVSFYNKRLVSEKSEQDECPQISVSINTDDLGIFSTSLYNEYALMASALEFAKDQKGEPLYRKDRIYDWIDDIRKMGNEQLFVEPQGAMGYCRHGEFVRRLAGHERENSNRKHKRKY